jgi:tRNA (guanosine-2'-O-)-methyltransferase
MRRDLPEVFQLGAADPLPAPAIEVVKALQPLLTEERVARIESVLASRTRSIVTVLDGLIDPHNVSAVIRSAEAFGVQELHIIEGSEMTVASPRVAKGSERWLDVSCYADAESCVNSLRRRGFRLYFADSKGTLEPAELRDHEPLALVFGNEHAGVSAKLRDLSDESFAIPMRGFVESLNVSVAAAIALSAVTRGKGGTLSEEDKTKLRARYMMLSIPRAREVIEELIKRKSSENAA